MEILGYIASLFIGISLGLIGGGGSILTVPVLVYLFGISPIIATSYSLFVVGATSLVGAVNNLRKGMVDLKTVILFGISSVLTVFLARKVLLPLVPPIISLAGWQISFATLTMLMFATLMMFASVSMIKSKRNRPGAEPAKAGMFKLAIYGIVVGMITGFLGAGGGFLLIPALVLIIRLPMRMAIGTSLMVIALNSLVGFVADTGHYPINWKLLLLISCIAIAGVFIGAMLGTKLSGQKLKKGFGWFILVMGVFIILRETLFH